MLLKIGFKVLLLAVEIFLGFYSMFMTDSLLIRFIFFAVSAMIIAFGVIKLINKILPVDKDYISSDQEDENISAE